MARELKYSSHNTDFDALQRELSGDSDGGSRSDERYDEPSDDEYDDYRR
ncbi:hypothetical protein FHS29_001169 [Saccharothrix tamanrassetensis]|uniref:DUF3073 domain-containing protein n=1 Tax=Saccharothrix tamanrassetensis TaxID=1051531 RepID=A0A841CB21_9PSEU|nr:hypothetical protein [Saccharothrix tamanrassetensis]